MQNNHICDKADGKILSPDFHTKVVNLNRNCCVVAIEGDVEGVVKIIVFYILDPFIIFQVRLYSDFIIDNSGSDYSLVGIVV